MRIDRMLAIIIFLLNRDRITAKELAEEFEVNIRTIYRDIEALQIAGIPIVSYQGNSGGYGILENYKIDKQYLSLKDISSIITALKSINKTLDDNNITVAIEKIKNLVPYNDKKTIEETLAVDMLPWGVADKLKVRLRSLNGACRSQKLVRFTYRNSSGDERIRTVEPMTLVLKGTAWYLFGYCTYRKDYRIFKLARMKYVEYTEKSFVRRNASYTTYFDQSPPETAMVTLKLKFNTDSQYYVEEYFEEADIVLDQDRNFIVTVAFPDTHWLISWLLSFGDMVEILEPAHYREQLLAQAHKIIKKYQT